MIWHQIGIEEQPQRCFGANIRVMLYSISLMQLQGSCIAACFPCSWPLPYGNQGKPEEIQQLPRLRVLGV